MQAQDFFPSFSDVDLQDGWGSQNFEQISQRVGQESVKQSDTVTKILVVKAGLPELYFAKTAKNSC